MLSCSSFSHASRSEARTAQAVWFGVVVTLHTECDVAAPFHTPASPASVRSSAYRSHHHAAAGVDILARQPTRLFAHHKGHDVGDILGMPSRLSGEACSPVWRKAGSAGIMAVSVNPGDTVFTVTPLDASSCARPFVNCSRAPLLPR